MTITDFLRATIAGELSLEDQKKYLMKKPHVDAGELADAVVYLYEQIAPRT